MEYRDYRGATHDDNRDGISCYRPTLMWKHGVIQFTVSFHTILATVADPIKAAL